LVKFIASIVGASVIWVASCLLLRKDNKINEYKQEIRRKNNSLVVCYNLLGKSSFIEKENAESEVDY
jgi:hypothetical protein